MTPAQRIALQTALEDGVLLIRKPSTYGSSDTRDHIRLDVCKRLVIAGMLRIDISHGDDFAIGFRVTEKGRAALEEASK